MYHNVSSWQTIKTEGTKTGVYIITVIRIIVVISTRDVTAVISARVIRLHYLDVMSNPDKAGLLRMRGEAATHPNESAQQRPIRSSINTPEQKRSLLVLITVIMVISTRAGIAVNQYRFDLHIRVKLTRAVWKFRLASELENANVICKESLQHSIKIGMRRTVQQGGPIVNLIGLIGVISATASAKIQHDSELSSNRNADSSSGLEQAKAKLKRISDEVIQASSGIAIVEYLLIKANYVARPDLSMRFKLFKVRGETMSCTNESTLQSRPKTSITQGTPVYEVITVIMVISTRAVFAVISMLSNKVYFTTRPTSPTMARLHRVQEEPFLDSKGSSRQKHINSRKAKVKNERMLITSIMQLMVISTHVDIDVILIRRCYVYTKHIQGRYRLYKIQIKNEMYQNESIRQVTLESFASQEGDLIALLGTIRKTTMRDTITVTTFAIEVNNDKQREFGNSESQKRELNNKSSIVKPKSH